MTHHHSSITPCTDPDGQLRFDKEDSDPAHIDEETGLPARPQYTTFWIHVRAGATNMNANVPRRDREVDVGDPFPILAARVGDCQLAGCSLLARAASHRAQNLQLAR